MAIDSRQITDLYGIRKGYAVFATGKGKNKRYGIIDRDGKIVAEPEFLESTLRFSNERYIQCCTTASYNPQYRLFDTGSGTWVAIDPNRRPWPIPEHNGLFYTHTQQNRCGIQDQTGRQIIPEKYGRIGHIGDNFIVENPHTGYCAIFTPDGEQTVPFSLRFEYVWPNNGRPLAKQDDKWYYIDGRGERISEIVLPDGTEWAELYGDRIVYGCGDKYASLCGMLDAADCKEILPPIYGDIRPFNRKYFQYDLDKASDRPCAGLVDHNGRQVMPMSECGVEPVEADDDLIIVRAPSRTDPEYSDCGLIHIGIDRSLTKVIPLQYAIPIMDNQGPEWIVAAVREPGRSRAKPIFRAGIFSLDGQLLVPFEYDDIRSGDDPERIAACKDDEWFFINLKNERTLF